MKRVSFFIFLFVLPITLFAQTHADSLNLHRNAVIKSIPITYDSSFQKIVKENRFLNTKGKPVAVSNRLRKTTSQNIAFYILLGVVSILAFLRFFYAQYFVNLFIVFCLHLYTTHCAVTIYFLSSTYLPN